MSCLLQFLAMQNTLPMFRSWLMSTAGTLVPLASMSSRCRNSRSRWFSRLYSAVTWSISRRSLDAWPHGTSLASMARSSVIGWYTMRDCPSNAEQHPSAAPVGTPARASAICLPTTGSCTPITTNTSASIAAARIRSIGASSGMTSNAKPGSAHVRRSAMCCITSIQSGPAPMSMGSPGGYGRKLRAVAGTTATTFTLVGSGDSNAPAEDRLLSNDGDMMARRGATAEEAARPPPPPPPGSSVGVGTTLTLLLLLLLLLFVAVLLVLADARR
mmetsp:Transcript_28610/g.70529  ORF Transcript_28610/g.70529 Transcript_28610/m.70529 type:complete len:272 (-) Transcript_28610:208-1023(-)